MLQGKLIVLEGIDGSGKATQAEMLINTLSHLAKVTFFDFPRYEESVFGQLLGRCLKGDYGDFITMTPYLSSLPYMLDRAGAAPKIRAALEEGYVVCNRYTTSSLAHQVAKVPQEERSALIDFIEQGEYGELGIPKPDHVIYLSVPTKYSQELITKKAKRAYIALGQADQAEEHLEHQSAAHEAYLMLASTRPEWHIIDCIENDKILHPRKIHEKVLAHVLSKLEDRLLHCLLEERKK